MALLQIKNVTKRFGGLTALNNVSFSVKKGEIHGLIGPNGAGKSTMFKSIAGFHTPTAGEVIFQGCNLVGRKPSEIARLGIVRTFQETTLFQELSVYENTLIGCHLSSQSSVLSALLGMDKAKRQRAHEKTLEILEFMGIANYKEQLASALPLGSQRALAVAIALAAEPKLMLMDEPFAGMNPQETGRMMELTRKVCESGVTIVLVEHDMKAVMGLCGRLTVLNFGNFLAQGTPQEVRTNEAVINAYLSGGK